MMEDMLAQHRSKLETDRQALRSINTAKRNPIVASRESLDAQKVTPKRRVAASSEHVGLQLGGYEDHQQRLRDQAKLEYNTFLDQNRNRKRFHNSPLIKADEENTPQRPTVAPIQEETPPARRQPSPQQMPKISPRVAFQEHVAATHSQQRESYDELLSQKQSVERKMALLGEDAHHSLHSKESYDDLLIKKKDAERKYHTLLTKENHEDSYEELLRKKKDAERRYRALLGEVPKASNNPDANKENAGLPRVPQAGRRQPPGGGCSINLFPPVGDGQHTREVRRLETLSQYDQELEDWTHSRIRNGDKRAVSSARDTRQVDQPLTEADRSKSVPAAEPFTPKSTVSLMRVGNSEEATSERKKQYALELRRQMEEQKKAKLREKQAYRASPGKVPGAAGAATAPSPEPEPSPRQRGVESNVRQRLNDRFSKMEDTAPAPGPATAYPGYPPANPAQYPPNGAPQYPGPPNGMPNFPPNPYMYPPNPYMYPGYNPMMQNPAMMNPAMMQNGMMNPQAMMGAGNPQAMMNPQYDPYQYYGLDKRANSANRGGYVEPDGQGLSPERRREPSGGRPQNRVPAAAGSNVMGAGRANVPRQGPAVALAGDNTGFHNTRADNHASNIKGPLDPSDYGLELKRQVSEREAQKAKKKAEEEAYNAKIEAEAANYNPWGRGGAGAPLKDSAGQSIANRVDMKAKAQDPHALQKDQKGTQAMSPKPDRAPNAGFGRVNEITGPQPEDSTRTAAKTEYQLYLKQQIEDRAAEKEREKERLREEDEKEANRVEAERLRIKQEFERDQADKARKDEEHKKQNEGLKQAAEQRRQEQLKREEAQRQNKTTQPAPAPAQYQVSPRPASPPLPTMRSDSPPIPTLANQQQQQQQQQHHQQQRGNSPPIPTHQTPQKPAPAPVVPKLDLSAQTSFQQPPDASERRPPTNLGANIDVSKEQVMNQLSALREQLNRLQSVKKEQSDGPKPANYGHTTPPNAQYTANQYTGGTMWDNNSVFEQAVQRAGKRKMERTQGPLIEDQIFDSGTTRREHQLDSSMRSLAIDDRGSLDNKCDSEFVPFTQTPEPGLEKYSNRPPSNASMQSFNIELIAKRNEERLRQLSNIASDRINREHSPDIILDTFLHDHRAGSEQSLECESSYRPV